LKWLTIQTRFVDYTAFKPLLDVIETSDDKVEALKELEEKLRELERNDMWITAIPLEAVKKKLEEGLNSISFCPNCGEWLEFIKEELGIKEHHETYECSGCGRRYEITFRPVSLKEVHR